MPLLMVPSARHPFGLFAVETDWIGLHHVRFHEVGRELVLGQRITFERTQTHTFTGTVWPYDDDGRLWADEESFVEDAMSSSSAKATLDYIDEVLASLGR